MLKRIILLLTLSPCYAAPPDGSPSMYSPWYRDLKTNYGGSCCDMSDCREVQVQWKYDHWIAKNGMEWVDIPPETILKSRHPEGKAVMCYSHGYVYCFVPPDLSY